MKQKDFEARVLAIWVRSRVPLTLAHVQHLTGATRDRSKQWLDAMTVAGVLDVEVADDGEMIWTVRGAERPRSGAETVAEWERMQTLTREVARAPTALAARALGGALVRGGDDKKSVVASGALSLVLGPLGWLYAAPLREAVPGAAVYVGLFSLLPHFLLVPLLGVLMPISGVAGVYYAWRHNQTGERTGLFSDRRKKV
ncbi:MAG TPA: hypothetical protein VIF57_16860 [Polyangia bacterium]|jgi:hypothetical protein